MNEREQELLDKQLWGVSPSPPERGALALAFAVVFFGGLLIGGILFPHKIRQTQMTAHDTSTTVVSLLNSLEPDPR
jgi:hypothetical protein